MLPCQYEPHRTLECARGQHDEHDFILRTESKAERAADEWRKDAYFPRLHAEDTTEIALDILHALRLVVDPSSQTTVAAYGSIGL